MHGRFGILALALVVVSTGCGGATKAGGHDLHQTVLRIATPASGDTVLADYVSAVDRLSGGAIRLIPEENWGSGAADPAAATVRDVSAGRVPLGDVDASSYARLGVHDFQAVTAPFLVDRLPLEESVLASPLASDMLEGVDQLGVVGLALLPGPLEHPFGLEQPLLGPRAYRDVVIGTTSMTLAAPALQALGAVPRAFRPPDLPPWRFAGAALDLSEAPPPVFGRSAVTANVAFWPRPSTVVGNPSILRRLGEERRRVLERAGRAVLGLATEHLQEEERSAVGGLCRHDRTAIVRSTPAEQTDLRAAVQPVYAKLDRDPLTRRLIGGIEKLKRTSAAAPPIGCAARLAPEAATTPLDGAWTMTPTRREAGLIDAGRYHLVLRRGRFRLRFSSPGTTGWDTSGSFRIAGRRLLFAYSDGTSGAFRWNLYRDSLTLRLVPGIAQMSNPTFAPWHRAAR